MKTTTPRLRCQCGGMIFDVGPVLNCESCGANSNSTRPPNRRTPQPDRWQLALLAITLVARPLERATSAL